jgi:hypothetical protein
MRNSTKLKLVLSVFDTELTMNDDECFKLVLINKRTGERMELEEKSFTRLMNNAFSFMKKQILN